VLGRDGIAGLVCLAASLWLITLTRGLPTPALVPIGPGFYPRIVLSVTAVLSAVLVIADLLARRRPVAGPSGGGERRNYRLVWVTFVIFSGYVAALTVLGYRVATLLFVLLLQVVLDPEWRRHSVRMVVVAAATAYLTYLVFEGYLSVLLPRGRWTGF